MYNICFSRATYGFELLFFQTEHQPRFSLARYVTHSFNGACKKVEFNELDKNSNSVANNSPICKP